MSFLAIESTFIPILYPQAPITPSDSITLKSVRLDFSPTLGFQAMVLCRGADNNVLVTAEVETRFAHVGNFKEQIGLMGQNEREAHFQATFDVEVQRLPDQGFKVFLGFKSLSSSQINNLNNTPSPLSCSKREHDLMTKYLLATGALDIIGGYNFSLDGKWVIHPPVGDYRFGSVTNSVAFSPDGTHVLSCSSGNGDGVNFFNLETKKEIHHLKGHRGSVECVAFSPHGNRGLSCGYDKTVRLWDLSSGNQLFCLEGHDAVVNSVAFSPDGKWGISGDNDGMMLLWDISSGEKCYSFRHSHRIELVYFQADGQHFIASANDAPVALWQVFDKKGNLTPSLIWSLPNRTFTIHNVNIEGASGLSETDSHLLREQI